MATVSTTKVVDLMPQIRLLSKGNKHLTLLGDNDEPYFPEFYTVIKTMRADLLLIDQNINLLQQATHETIHSLDGARHSSRVNSLIDEINATAQKLLAQLRCIENLNSKTMKEVVCKSVAV